MQNRVHHSLPPLNIVWFKRDLRVQDNRVLAEAAQSGAVVPLFVVEDEFWHQPDMSARQWAFVQECIFDLRSALHKLLIGSMLSDFFDGTCEGASKPASASI